MVNHPATDVPKRRLRTAQKTQTDIPYWRIYALMIVAMLVVVRIAVRLGDVQIAQHTSLSAMARGEISKEIVLQPDRGVIEDRYGNILAMDVERQSLFINPSQIAPERAANIALTLATLMDEDPQKMIERFQRHHLQWVRVARWLEPTIADKVATLQEPGLYLVYEPRRIYPQKEFASHIIGAVNEIGEGVSGIESYYNNELTGITGTLEAEFDSSHNPIAIAPYKSTPPQPGVNIRLTLDPLVQHVAETELDKAIKKNNAESGLVIIMEPSTGAIRGLATWPRFDPNRYGDYAPEIYNRNPALSNLYEPGSTFKMVTVAAGLQARAFTADTQVNDTGVINRFDVRIHNWNHAGNGMIDPGGVLYHSSNVGSVLFNELTGPDDFYAIVKDFGFGSPTGIDMAGEEAGIVHDSSSPGYNEILLRTNAYGQGIAVTPLQMVQAAATIANDGKMMQPYIVERRCWTTERETDEQQSAHDSAEAMEDRQEQCETTEPVLVRQVVDQGVAWTIRRMLVHSANHYAPIIWSGYADKWLVPGYEVCAKTGTASIPLPEGGYDPYHVIGSVLGFAPAEDTRYVILVKIDKPKGDAWGLATSVPVFHTLVEQLMQYERIAPNPELFSPGQ